MEEILSYEELAAALNRTIPNLKFQAGELRKITPETVIFIYTKLLEQLGYEEDQYYKPGNLEATRYLEEPEIHEGILPILHFFMTLKKVFHRLGFRYPLEFQDITNPQPLPTRARLSALIQFVQEFRRDTEMCKELIAQQVYSQENLEHYKQGTEQLNMELNSAILELEKKKNRPSEIESPQQRYERLESSLVELKDKVAGHKEKNLLLESTKIALMGRIMELEEKHSIVDRKIILDPEGEVKMQDELRSKLELLKIEKETLEKSLNQVRSHSSTGTLFPKKDLMIDCLEDFTRTEAAEKKKPEEVAELKRKIRRTEISIRDTQEKLQGITETLSSHKSEAAKNKMICQQKLGELRDQNDQLKLESEALDKEVKFHEKQAAARYEKQEELTKKQIAIYKKRKEELIKDYREAVTSLQETRLKKYNPYMEAKMKDLLEKIKAINKLLSP